MENSISRKVIVIFLISLLIISCNKENPSGQKNETSKTEEQGDYDSETSLTPVEAFSSTLVQDMLNEEEDVDLEIYLEEQIYPLVSKSAKVTIDRISSSVYLLSYDDNGVMKNISIQKFYSPGKDEIFFEKSEIQNDSLKQFLK